MEMASLTTEAQQLIKQDELGLPLETYGPPTTSALTGGVVSLIVAASLAGFCIYVLVWNIARTSFSWSIIELNRGFLFALSVLILWSLFFSIVGFRSIFRAISNRTKRIIICTHGVAVLQGGNAESFRWQEVLTSFALPHYKTFPSFTLPRYKVCLIFTVHCRNGRKFVFQDLSGIEQLAESIEVQVARAKLS
jgi:hypothetical protein